MSKQLITFVLLFSLFIRANVSAIQDTIMNAVGNTIEVENVTDPQEFPEDYEPIYTEYKSEESEEFLWNTLDRYSPSEMITAGILGYFKRESELKSTAVSHWQNTLAVLGEDHCVIFTEAIDDGLLTEETREKFVNECHNKYGGYGLGQWSSAEYCNDLYSYASAT